MPLRRPLGLPLVALVMLCGLAEPTSAQSLGSCAAELEAIRDRLRPLVAEANERAAACGARDDYLRRIATLTEQANAMRADLDASREEGERLRREAAQMVELLQKVATRATELEPRGTCETLRPAQHSKGVISLQGRVSNRAEWRSRAERASERLGVPISAEDLHEERCTVRVAPGWQAEPAEVGFRMTRPAGIGEDAKRNAPRTEDCAALGRQLARMPSDTSQRVSSFWVWGPPPGDGEPHGWMVCIVSGRAGDGNIRRPNGLEEQVLITRESGQ